MTWILIWVLQGGLSLTPTASATFDNQAACEQAKDWILHLNLNNRVAAECFPSEVSK